MTISIGRRGVHMTGAIAIGGLGAQVSGGGLSFLLRSDFTTAVAAPIPSPYSAEPGPGRLVRSADTNNRVSIDAGDFLLSGLTNVSYADPAYYWTDASGAAFARAAGLTAVFATTLDNVLNFGLSTSAVVATATVHGLRVATLPDLQMTRLSNPVSIGVWQENAAYLVAMTLRANGSEIRIKGGAYDEWSLLFVDTTWSDAALYPAVASAGTLTTRMASVRGLQLAALAATQAQSVTPVSGTIYPAMPVDAVHVLQLSGPVGAAGRFCELRYRVADANNYMFARHEWNDGTSQWDFETGHVIAGVETVQGTTIANHGTIGRIVVRCVGNNHDIWSVPSSATIWTKRYATIVDSSGASNTGVAVVQVGGYTLTNLLSFAYRDTAIASVLDAAAL